MEKLCVLGGGGARETDTQTHRHTDRHTDTQTDTQTGTEREIGASETK